MFTGIISSLGKVVARTQNKDGSLRLELETPFPSLNLGESVAVDGVCLTVLSQKKLNDKTFFEVELSNETLRASVMEQLPIGAPVNLERSLKVGDRLGGHFVQGHVDAPGKIISIAMEGNSKCYTFSGPPIFQRYLVPKGSIAINGVSLTIAAIKSDQQFSVSMLEFTEKSTTFQTK